MRPLPAPLLAPDELALLRACRPVTRDMLPRLVRLLPREMAASRPLELALGAARLREALLLHWFGLLAGEPARDAGRAAAALAHAFAEHGVGPEAAALVQARLLAGLLHGLGLGAQAVARPVPVAAETRRQARLRCVLTRLCARDAEWLALAGRHMRDDAREMACVAA